MNIMPMIYLSRKAAQLLEKLVSRLEKRARASVRIVKSDVLYEALKYYSQKLEGEEHEDMA